MWVKFCVARLRNAQPNAAEMEDNEPSTADGDDDDLGDLDGALAFVCVYVFVLCVAGEGAVLLLTGVSVRYLELCVAD